MKKLLKNLWRAAVVLTVASCGGIPYKDDLGYKVSAQANSHEFPIRVNGRLCKDIDGKPGACTIQIKSNEPLILRFDPMSYGYQFIPECTQGVQNPGGATVEQNKVFTWTVNPSDFAEFTAFTCRGQIAPNDRAMPISALFRITVLVVDQAYEGREGIYIQDMDNKKYAVFGQYCRMAWARDAGKWTRYDKTTAIEIKGNPDEFEAYCESYAMRYNYKPGIRRQ